MSSPLVSIIIPVYNAEIFLHKCIESIISQTYSHFELLLIDDCSEDNSPSICKSYSKKDCRISFIRNSTNKGVTITRNIGLDNAKGEYVLFIDNDDYVDNNYIETFIDSLQEQKEADLLTQDIYFHYQDKEPFIETNQLSLGGPWGKLFKKNTIDKGHIRFIPNLKYNEDNLFLLDFLEQSNLIFNISHAGYHYIVHDNCTSKKLEKDYIETGKGLSLLLKCLEINTFRNEYNRSFAENRCSFIFHRYISALYFMPFKNIKERLINYRTVIKSANHALKYHPNIYKTDKYIILMLRVRFYTLAFFTNDILYYVRHNHSDQNM